MTPTDSPLPRVERWPAFAAFGLLFLWYALTGARDLMFYDTGELALAAETLGLAHPPGHPLFVYLGWLFSHLPGVPALWGLNLLSALSVSLCALPADALVRRFTDASPWVRLLALLATGALAPMWDQGTRIEVYPLATLGGVTLLAWGAKAVAETDARARTWVGLGLATGLTASVNPVFAIAAAWAVGLYATPMLLRQGKLVPMTRTWMATFGAVIGALPYLHIYWARTRDQAFVWGDLGTPEGIKAFLTGADYAHNADGAWGLIPAHAVDYSAWLLGQGALPVALMGLAGWLASPRARRALLLPALPLLAAVAFVLGYQVYYPEIPDFNAYFATAQWCLPVGLAFLLSRLPQVAGYAAAAGLLLSATFTGERPLWSRSRAQVTLARDLATAYLNTAPKDALLLVASDHLVFPLMYLQHVERLRPDVVVLNVGFAASAWYWEDLHQAHPNLERIELKAPDTPTRLRRLLIANHDLPVRVESVDLAAEVGFVPCPATWGFGLGFGCADVTDDHAAFLSTLRGWWATPAADDLTARRVLSAVAQERATGLWLLGQPKLALEALAAGVPNAIAATLPIPEVQGRGPAIPLTADVLIGSPEANLTIGAAFLKALNQPQAAAAWLDARP